MVSRVTVTLSCCLRLPAVGRPPLALRLRGSLLPPPHQASILSTQCWLHLSLSLYGLYCTCHVLSVLSCFCTNHSALLNCELFCFGCYILLLRRIAPGRPSQWPEDLFIHPVFTGYHIPPKYSFNPLFSRASHFNFQFTIGGSFFYFPGRAEATCVSSTPTLSSRISPWNFIPSLVLFLSPNPYLFRDTDPLALEFSLPYWFLLK